MWSKFFNYIVGGGSYYGVPKKRKFCLGWVKYVFLAISYFFSSCITEEEINDLKQLYLYYLGALERSNNSYIESIVEPSVYKDKKEIFTMWLWLGKKSWKGTEAMKKSIHEIKVEFVYLCVREKKITVITLRYIKNVNLLFKKDFKIAEVLIKISFFLYCRDRP